MLREEHGRYFPSADGQLATILNRTMGMLKCLVLQAELKLEPLQFRMSLETPNKNAER
jgi:hypothetical protein